MPANESAMPELEEQRTGSLTSSDTLQSREGANATNASTNSISVSRATSRIDRIQSQGQATLSRIRSQNPRAPFGHPLENEKTSLDVIVDFDGPGDPYHPLNWVFKKKAITTVLYGMITMTTSFATAVYSPSIRVVSSEFHKGVEVATLGTALMLFGMALGPLLWGPLSELYGRKKAVLPPTLVGAVFTFGSGAADNIQTLLICRFFMGFFGSAPVTNTGGVLADIWMPEQRGVAMLFYSLAIAGGPTVAPLIGASVTTSHLGWRWAQYFTGIMQMLVLAFGVLFLDESHPDTLLVIKARRLRHKTGNWALHCRHEEWDATFREMAHKYLVRPFVLLATPICALMVFYASFTYSMLYAALGAFPYIFENVRGWNQVVGTLPFLAFLTGVFLGFPVNLANQAHYKRVVAANGGRAVPEARLYPMMFGGIIFAGGLFMLAWTATPSVPWIVPCIAIALIGCGFYTIFQTALNYLVDTFLRYSASAIAANTFVRCAMAGAYPLFITQQLEGVGVGWGLSIVGFVAALMIPLPFFFNVYGKRIRAAGKWSKESV